MTNPPFRDDQRAYLRAFNFEALLLKHNQRCHPGHGDGDGEPWVACWEGNVVSGITDMKLYKQLWDVGTHLVKDMGPCKLQRVESSVEFDERKLHVCRIRVHAHCVLILSQPNLIFEALARKNDEMLEVWLGTRPDVAARINEPRCGGNGETPLEAVMRGSNTGRLDLLLNHGALPLGMSATRFAAYATHMKRPVIRKWRRYVRGLTYALLAIGHKRRAHRHEFAAFAREVWGARRRYR